MDFEECARSVAGLGRPDAQSLSDKLVDWWRSLQALCGRGADHACLAANILADQILQTHCPDLVDRLARFGELLPDGTGDPLVRLYAVLGPPRPHEQDTPPVLCAGPEAHLATDDDPSPCLCRVVKISDLVHHRDSYLDESAVSRYAHDPDTLRQHLALLSPDELHQHISHSARFRTRVLAVFWGSDRDARAYLNGSEGREFTTRTLLRFFGIAQQVDEPSVLFHLTGDGVRRHVASTFDAHCHSQFVPWKADQLPARMYTRTANLLLVERPSGAREAVTPVVGKGDVRPVQVLN